MYEKKITFEQVMEIESEEELLALLDGPDDGIDHWHYYVPSLDERYEYCIYCLDARMK